MGNTQDILYKLYIKKIFYIFLLNKYRYKSIVRIFLQCTYYYRDLAEHLNLRFHFQKLKKIKN